MVTDSGTTFDFYNEERMSYNPHKALKEAFRHYVSEKRIKYKTVLGDILREELEKIGIENLEKIEKEAKKRKITFKQNLKNTIKEKGGKSIAQLITKGLVPILKHEGYY